MPHGRTRFAPYGFFTCAVIGLGACESGGQAAQQVSRAPAKAGDLWELDPAVGREGSPAAMLAYVNGLHVLVLDGSDIYAGMTRLRTDKGDGGSRILRLSDSLTAELTPAGDAMELRFSTGESISMHRRETR